MSEARCADLVFDDVLHQVLLWMERPIHRGLDHFGRYPSDRIRCRPTWCGWITKWAPERSKAETLGCAPEHRLGGAHFCPPNVGCLLSSIGPLISGVPEDPSRSVADHVLSFAR